MVTEINALRKKYIKAQQDLVALRDEMEGNSREFEHQYQTLLMDIIDQLDGLEAAQKELTTTAQLLDAKSSLEALLHKHGVEKFRLPFMQFSKNTDFAHIVATVKNKNLADGVLVSVEKEAYRKEDRIFRPASIIVANNA